MIIFVLIKIFSIIQLTNAQGCENTDNIGKSEWQPIIDCRKEMNLAVTPPDGTSRSWRTSKFDSSNDNQLWRQDSQGRIINKANGKVFVWDRYGTRFEGTNSGFKWSFNRCVRSSQDRGQISQKFQAKYGSENRCLNTGNRFDKRGSVLMMYPCESIHPVNGCFKFKEAFGALKLNQKGKCSLETCNHVTSGIYAVWWRKEKEDQTFWANKAADVGRVLSELRLDLMESYGLTDPPNVAKGLYVNIYIGYANGNFVGTEDPSASVPYMNIASIDDKGVYAHESHHLFIWTQEQGSSKWKESYWLVESAAQFYAGQYDKKKYTRPAYTYTTVNPHLALWQYYYNMAPKDPLIFMYYSKTYAMQILLYYLVEEKGVRSNDLLDYYVKERGMSPQEYWYRLLGGDNMRQWFADWAAHNAADMDYLTREQFKQSVDYFNELVSINQKECTPSADCGAHSYVWEGLDAGTGGLVRPPTAPLDLTTRGWSYNVWRLNSTKANTYTFELKGDSKGSEGAESYFLARVVVMNGNVEDNQYYPMVMSSATSGSVRVEVPDGDTQVLLVVSSVPEYFKSHQTYGYQVRIS